MKNLVVRSLSGIVYVGLIVGCILLGKYAFAVLTAAFAILALVEFRNITVGAASGAAANVALNVDCLGAVAACFLPVLVMSAPYAPVAVSMVIVVCYFVLRFTVALYDKGADAFKRAAMSAAAFAYIVVPMSALNFIYGERFSEKAVVLCMFIMIWLNDTGAYCAGSLFGRHKLFPRLSPKKSWEGFVGGLIFCIAAGVAASYILDNISIVAGIILGIMVCVLSTWGDLFESLLKRTHSIKDSGNLIPGHGGILDRIDSLLFVAPAMALFVMFVC